MAGVSKKAFKPDSVKVVINFAKQHTEPDIWDYATAHPQAAIKQWLELRAKVASFDVRQPTRPAGCTDTLQIVVLMGAHAWITALRASGTDGVFVRPFVERDEDKLVYRAVPMPRDTTLVTAIRQAVFYGEKAFGVVPYGSGYGIRLKSEHFEEMLRQIQPEHAEQFLGKRWEISGLPLAMGAQNLQDFLGEWKMRPIYTFRQGFRRTWIVQAAANPTENILAHDFGVAVVKDAVQKRNPLPTERLQVSRAHAPPQTKRYEKQPPDLPKC